MCHQTQWRGQRGHCVAVHPDNQAGVLAPGIEFEHTLVFVIRATSGSKAAQYASFDGRRVRGQKAKSGADLVVRVGICRMVLEPPFAESQRVVKGIVKCNVERGCWGGSWKVG